VTFDDGRRAAARAVLLATGVSDELPAIVGLERFYGRSVFVCPYCSGWEVRDGALAALGQGRMAFELAVGLKAWSDDVILFTDGPADYTTSHRAELARYRVGLCEEPVRALRGDGDVLTAIEFASGDTVPRRALFISAGQHQQAELALQLGCRLDLPGAVDPDTGEAATVPGLFVAGDLTRGVQLAIIAAGEGAQAAVAIHRFLRQSDGAVRRVFVCIDNAAQSANLR
jgi:thioredoxin reductase